MNDRKDASQQSELSEALLSEAAAWWLRIQETPEDEGLAAGAAAWRALAADNEAAWQLAAISWGAAVDQRPRPAIRPFPVRRRYGAGALTALAACLLAAVFYPDLSLWLRADYSTETGVTRSIALSDGSVVTLGAASALGLQFSPDARRVALLRGEAYFDVAKDSVRPFIVTAEHLTVMVTGTQFAVATHGDSVEVDVAEGSVHVAYKDADSGKLEADLRSGERIDVMPGMNSFAHSKIEPANIAPWRSGRLVAQDMSLRDVVASIDRYQPGIILFADDALAEKRVTGVFSLTDPQRALQGALALYGGEVYQTTPYLTVLAAGTK